MNVAIWLELYIVTIVLNNLHYINDWQTVAIMVFSILYTNSLQESEVKYALS